MLKLFTVQADAETGEWVAATLEQVGEIDRAAHLAKADTDAVHYDTLERPEGDHTETCAVEVHWIAAA